MIASSKANTIFAYFTTEEVNSGCAKRDGLTRYLLSWMIHGWFGLPSSLLLETENHCTPLTQGLSPCREQKSMALLTYMLPE